MKLCVHGALWLLTLPPRVRSGRPLPRLHLSLQVLYFASEQQILQVWAYCAWGWSTIATNVFFQPDLQNPVVSVCCLFSIWDHDLDTLGSWSCVDVCRGIPISGSSMELYRYNVNQVDRSEVCHQRWLCAVFCRDMLIPTVSSQVQQIWNTSLLPPSLPPSLWESARHAIFTSCDWPQNSSLRCKASYSTICTYEVNTVHLCINVLLLELQW